MSGFTAYKTYLAVNNHFKNKSYDYFKYNGVVKVKEQSFLARKDKYFFEKIARRFDESEFVKYLVANFCVAEDNWIGEIINASNEIKYKKWKKRIEAITYTFEQEIDYLSNLEENFNSIFVSSGETHPLLYRSYLRNNVSLETLIILDYLVGYSIIWSKKEDTMMREIVFLLEKYKPFFFHYVKPQREKWKNIVLEKWYK